MFEQSIHDDIVREIEGFIQKGTKSLPAHFVWRITRILKKSVLGTGQYLPFHYHTVILLKIWTNLSISLSESFVFRDIFSVNFSVLFFEGKLLANAVVMISTVTGGFNWSDLDSLRPFSSNHNNFFFPQIFLSFSLLFFYFWIPFKQELHFVVISYNQNTPACFAGGGNSFIGLGISNLQEIKILGKLRKMRVHTAKELLERSQSTVTFYFSFSKYVFFYCNLMSSLT